MPDLAVIMLVEDREDDIFLVRKSFERAWIDNPLQVVRNGEEAMHYLAGEGRYSRRTEYPLPDQCEAWTGGLRTCRRRGSDVWLSAWLARA